MAGADLEIAELESSSPRPSGPVRVPFRRPLLVAALFSLVYLLAYSSLSVVLDHNRPLLAKVANPLELIPPLFAAVFLERNARGKNSRERWFWYLLALGTAQWFVGQLLWVYFEVFLGQPVPDIFFFGDIVFFLRIVPFLAAAGLRPDRQRLPHGYRPTYLDFTFLVLWWIFLYSFMVLPWQFIQPDPVSYSRSYNRLWFVENLIWLGALAYLLIRAESHRWRNVYIGLALCHGLYYAGSHAANLAIQNQTYYTGSFYDLPLLGSFLMLGCLGVYFRRQPAPDLKPDTEEDVASSALPSALALLAILSIPFIAILGEFVAEAPPPVEEFRHLVTLIFLIPTVALFFLRQRYVQKEQLRLTEKLQQNYRQLQHLHRQLVQSEKMRSLGRLVAGAAHEINNPLTAILGYTDVLLAPEPLSAAQRELVGKLQAQGRRTKTLVQHLLSFSRQSKAVTREVNVHDLLEQAILLNEYELRAGRVRLHPVFSDLPGIVRGDPQQLLQVFVNVIRNAADSIRQSGQPGTLRISHRCLTDRVRIEFTDTGVGVREPEHVFDPFYTTKAVGQGAGLGLSICYGILQQHQGSISCCNNPGRGVTFTIELPLVKIPLPEPSLSPRT